MNEALDLHLDYCKLAAATAALRKVVFVCFDEVAASVYREALRGGASAAT